MQKIELTVENQRIDGNLFIPENEGKNPGVIFLHGMTSSETKYIPMAQRLVDVGIAGMTINLRGHGTSEGSLDTLTVFDALIDVRMSYDFFVAQKGIDPERIGICGSSFGALLGIMLADERRVQSLLLRAPALYTDSMMRMYFNRLIAHEDTLFHEIANISGSAAIRVISKFSGSVLVVASENDEIIPMPIPYAIYDAATKAKKRAYEVMKGAPHSLKDEKQILGYTNRMIRWFKDTL
jgi:esterase/lipase